MRKPSRVFLEWDKLVFDYERPPEVKEPEWRALYESCWADGDWSVSLDDALLVTHLGMTISLQLKQCHQSSALAERLLLHPKWKGIEESDWVSWSEMRRRLGQSKLLEGKLEEGMKMFHEILDSEYAHKPYIPAVLVRNSLVELCMFSPNEVEHALPELKQLSHRVLFQWAGKERKAAKSLKVTTVGELLKLLESTYPKRVKFTFGEGARRVRTS